VAVRAISLLTKSSVAEKMFLITGIVISDHRMVIGDTHFSAQVMVKANWEIMNEYRPEILTKRWPRRWSSDSLARVGIPDSWVAVNDTI
jgi:hypothetical protein